MSPRSSAARSDLDWLAGGGEMSRAIRALDWSRSPLGPLHTWPPSLRTTVSLCLASSSPINIVWGPEHNQIYNDGYWPICGAKHPTSMGQDFRDCWASAWPAIGEPFERALAGETAYLQNQRMFLDRNGYLEETFFTFSFSAIRDEHGRVGGLFHPVTETTSIMLSERRTRTLRDLATHASKAHSVEDACALVAKTLAPYAFDLPFVLLYFGGEREARLVASTGLVAGMAGCPRTQPFGAAADRDWPLGAVRSSGRCAFVDDVEQRFGLVHAGAYQEPVTRAVVHPLVARANEQPFGMLVAGLSTRLPLDEGYRGFLELLTSAVATVLNNARAYEQERQRSEALAELDRAKTEFFSNVSHELRTPLTLILGPVDDAMTRPAGSLTGEPLQMVHRNVLRLSKMVNALLDFARTEAGRAQAMFVPTDLGAMTADLASAFRSSIERAGLALDVDSPVGAAVVAVDPELWEKIVLNLLSNAVKYTHAGSIHVQLRVNDDDVVLTVRDTGVGIPEAELPRVFERFHRVRSTEGRSHEGTGIGLALVKELVALHGGTVDVASELGMGSTFTVTLPRTSSPTSAVAKGAARPPPSPAVAAHVTEVQRWDPPGSPVVVVEGATPLAAGPRPRVLLVDDNPDLRAYVSGVLQPLYDVAVAGDGQAALEHLQGAEKLPDLVITDVMMPRLDGFGLLAALRAAPSTRELPVILLSARAGEEATVDGLAAGADDYLVKPFAARELLARVRTRLELQAMRKASVAQAQALADLEAHRLWNEDMLGALPLPLLFAEPLDAPQPGRILFVNRALQTLFGAPFPCAAPLTDVTRHRFTNDDDVPLRDDEAPCTRALRGEEVCAAPVVWHTPAGRKSVLVDGRLLPAAYGRPAMVALSLHDVTPLTAAQAELRDAVVVREEFVSVASHELRTPLTALDMQLHALERQLDDFAKDHAARTALRRRVHAVRRQGDRLAALAGQLTDVTRMERDGDDMPLQLAPVDLAALVRDVVAELREVGTFERAKTELQTSLHDGACAQLDHTKLAQVVRNLLANACKFGAGRPIRVSVDAADADELVLQVADEGIGIRSDDLERIFGRFERAVSTREYGGLGLGLFISRRIVEAHGGTITATSSLGRGATFTVRLPRRPPAATTLAAP